MRFRSDPTPKQAAVMLAMSWTLDETRAFFVALADMREMLRSLARRPMSGRTEAADVPLECMPLKRGRVDYVC